MKSKIISFVAVTSIMLFSSLAIADGSHCDSMMKGKRPHDMSPEAWQQFKDAHSWLFSKDKKAADKSATPKSDSAQRHPTKPSSDSMAI